MAHTVIATKVLTKRHIRTTIDFILDDGDGEDVEYNLLLLTTKFHQVISDALNAEDTGEQQGRIHQHDIVC